FQAEDGIRDATVTGVQTCALPISALALWTARGAALVLLALGVYIWTGGSDQLITVHVVVGVLLVLCLWTIAAIAAASGVSAVVRSEERRVGKVSGLRYRRKRVTNE